MCCPAGYDSFVMLICVLWEDGGLEPSNPPPSWVSSPLNYTLYAYADLTWWLGWWFCQALVCVQSILQKVIKEMQKKKQAVNLGHETQSPSTLSVWTRISKSYTHQWGSGESKALFHYSNPESLLLRPATVMLSTISCVQYVYVHTHPWAYLLSWIQLYKASVKVN